MIKGFILSLQFFTRIPINIPIDFNKKNLAKSTFFLPLIGIILGGISGGIYYLFSFINLEIASIITVVTMIFLTGGLHLDGLADTLDGFMANKDKEITLEIMQDSRVGAFGVIGLILIILTKFVAIWSIQGHILIVLILSLGNSRLVLLYKMAYNKVAKLEGLGYMFHSSNPKKYAILGVLIYIIILISINPIYLIPLITSIIIGEIITYISYKKIGGLTGDVYGAIIELGEIGSLIMFMEVIKWT